MEIQAAVVRASETPYRLETVTLADPGPDEVLVRISAVGMCHTDLLPKAPSARPMVPIIPGHEGAGVVEAVGTEVSGVSVGDHAVLSFDSCGTCLNCRAGHPAYCDTAAVRNMTGTRVDGSTPVRDEGGNPVRARWFGQSSFATHALATARNIVVVDKELPLELLAPLGCGVQTGAGSVLNALRVSAGSTFVVYGAGAVGLSAVMAAHLTGAATIVAVDLNESRLRQAAELGATHIVHSGPDTGDQVLAATGGGAQFALDTTGIPDVISTAVRTLRVTGTCGLVGLQHGELRLRPKDLAVGRNLMGIVEGDADPQRLLPQLISLWRQGRFPFDSLVRTFPLAEINEAEKAALSGEVVKPVLLPA